MNKKLDKLIDEAGFVRFTAEENPGRPIDWSSNYDKELEKLAELIVLECAKPLNNIFKQGGGTYGEVILKHFGVKIGPK